MFFVAKIQGGFFCAKMRRRLYIFIATNCNKERCFAVQKAHALLGKKAHTKRLLGKGQKFAPLLGKPVGKCKLMAVGKQVDFAVWNGFGAFDGSGKGKSIGKKQKANLVVGELNGRRD